MTPLGFDTLLAHYHAEVWEAAAEENGKIAYDEAGVDTAKKLCKGYADLERQVAALTKERDEAIELWKIRGFTIEVATKNIAAEQAYSERLREALESVKNSVVGGGYEYSVMSEALALPSDTTALQARLAEEREKVIALYSPDDTAQDWIDKIRSMK